MYKFWIPGRLPGLNEILKARGTSKMRGKAQYSAYTDMKRQTDTRITFAILAARLPKLKRITLHFEYIEPNKKRDPDNIAAGKKFILDALQDSSIIENDGWEQIAGWHDSFKVDKNDGVMVTINEVE